MIDLHCHVLPGIDDGPPDVAGSLDLARVAQAAGIDTLVATPHVTWDLPLNTGERVAAGVATLGETLGEAGIAVDVRTGGEVAISRAAELPDAELEALRLGGGEWLLSERPVSPGAAGFTLGLRALHARGHRIVLAHPERSPAVQRDPALLRALVDEGMLSSITAGSLVGQFGSTVRAFALELIAEGLVHNLTSDAHDAVRRPPGLRDAALAADGDLPGLADRLEWMCLEVPGAVLAGGPVPAPPGPPPQPAPRRGLLRRVARRR